MKNIRSLLALVLVLAGACAGTRGQPNGTGNDPGGVSVQVENTGTLSSDITVYLVSSGGGRQLLGTVRPNRTETLRYRGIPAGGQYRLLARPTGGREIASNSFLLNQGATIRWNLQSNIAVAID
ncbi:MAG: hypothetical protein ICV87_03360 [Gemmatimonadetes bacterium]|nr:hypothetical protein [Gemmatimonadota bacterium]